MNKFLNAIKKVFKLRSFLSEQRDNIVAARDFCDLLLTIADMDKKSVTPKNDAE